MSKVELISLTPDAEKTMAYIARVSNPKNQENEDYSKLLSYCIKNEHWSVFEQSFMTLQIETNRGIAAQILRHRSFTFQEFSQRYADSSQLGGPIRIAKISGQVAEFGILPFLSMMAYISISLGLINLFPIPLLDGGHLMFYGFEKVLGKPLSQKTQEGFFRIGMFLLLSLMFFATMNDLRDLGLF